LYATVVADRAAAHSLDCETKLLEFYVGEKCSKIKASAPNPLEDLVLPNELMTENHSSVVLGPFIPNEAVLEPMERTTLDANLNQNETPFFAV